MKKRILSFLLAVSLVLSLSSGALAATYKDISGHWAEEPITKLSELGYLTGYSDGTVRPDNPITAVEALSMLSRFYSINDEIKQWVHEDYGDFVARYVDPSLSWAYDEIELCLASGILSETELKNLRLTASIEKELLAVLLVRAMQMTDEAAKLSETQLTFADALDINTSYVGQVALLVEGKIIEGDSNNKFNPHSKVNRAVLAKMVVCGLDYLKELNKTVELTDYKNYSNLSGIITSATTSTIFVRDYAAVTRKYVIPAAAAVTENGKATVLSPSLANCFVTVRVENGAIVSVAVENTEGITWVQGVLTSYSASGSGSSIYVTNPETNASTRYAGADAMKIFRKGAVADANSIKTNDFATMKIKGGSVVELYLDDSSYSVSGTIETLTLGAKVTFNITDTAGTVRCYPLDIGKLPTIQRGTNPITIERLRVGDEVTLTVKNGVVSTIATSSANADTLDGTLTTITTTTGGTTWVVTDAQGVVHALSLDPAVAAYQGSKAIDISAIQVGDSVGVECYGTTIITVTLKSSQTNTATKLSGTVLAVDTSGRTITVLSSADKLIYITTNGVNSILSTITNRTIFLSDIKINNQIVAYGAYSNGTTFAATSLVVEG